MTSLLQPGAEVAGYRVLSELGRGGMGLVYEAEHVRLGRKAALKLLTPDLAADSNVRDRFVQESRLIAAIDHPNIIPIYDAGEIGETLYIAMRLVGGGDLAKLIGRERTLGVERTVALVEQAAAALDAAHARGMVHRDVKPANVLLDDAASDRAFLTDFGVAKLTGGARETKAGMFIGSVDYASPEQIQGGEIAPAVDVYALGCVLFECLTGRRPYRKNTNVAILFGHLRDPPPRVTDERDELPKAIDEVVATALAKDPAERYGSCGELAAAARAALVGEAAAARALRQRVSTKPGSERAPLPTPATELVGRESELEAVRALLADPEVQLVTLTGPGGTGKTRLALAAAAATADEFPGGALLVELETLADAGLVLAAIAERLGASDADAESLAGQLAEERPLLVLDNFEHVLPAAPQIASLVAAPGAKVLVTSRAPLRVRAEREHPVPPLEPSAAVRLFQERAREARPGFEPSGADADAVAEICARLDGLPLAIELAAARVRLLSPAEMLSRLDRRLALLTSAEQDVPSRHRTMRGTVEWSYDLLDEPAKVLLARLAVFSGGWRMAAAEAVCVQEPELDSYALLDATSALVDGSLVRSGAGAGGEPRFELLQLVQEFGLYQLIERGELETFRRRHAEHYAALAEEAEPEITGADQVAWLRRLAEETGNLRAALRFSEDSGELELGLRVAGALTRFWSVQGLMTEIRAWLSRALPNAFVVDAPVRARARFAAGHAALGQGDFAAAAAEFEAALEAYRELDDDRGQAACLAQLGWLASARGDVDAASASSARSLAVAEELGAWDVASVARSTLGDLAAQRGAYPQAAELHEQSLTLRRRLGDRRNMANALLSLGRVELLRADPARAATLTEEGLSLAREVDDTWSISVGTATLGLLALDAGQLEQARSYLTDALELAWRRGDDRNVTESLFALAAVAAPAGDVRAATRIWGAAEAIRDSIGASPSPTERALEDRYLSGLRHALGTTAFESERRAGAALPREQAVDRALGVGST
jgi:non-specific serine/threonine protein kinase